MFKEKTLRFSLDGRDESWVALGENTTDHLFSGCVEVTKRISTAWSGLKIGSKLTNLGVFRVPAWCDDSFAEDMGKLDQLKKSFDSGAQDSLEPLVINVHDGSDWSVSFAEGKISFRLLNDASGKHTVQHVDTIDQFKKLWPSVSYPSKSICFTVKRFQGDLVWVMPNANNISKSKLCYALKKEDMESSWTLAEPASSSGAVAASGTSIPASTPASVASGPGALTLASPPAPPNLAPVAESSPGLVGSVSSALMALIQSEKDEMHRAEEVVSRMCSEKARVKLGIGVWKSSQMLEEYEKMEEPYDVDEVNDVQKRIEEEGDGKWALVNETVNETTDMELAADVRAASSKLKAAYANAKELADRLRAAEAGIDAAREELASAQDRASTLADGFSSLAKSMKKRKRDDGEE